MFVREEHSTSQGGYRDEQNHFEKRAGGSARLEVEPHYSDASNAYELERWAPRMLAQKLG